MKDIEYIGLDDGSTLIVYRVSIPNGWRWTHRDKNYESPRDGLLASSRGSFPSWQAAKKDFFMHNNHDSKDDQKPSWVLISAIVICIIMALAVIATSNRARAHDIYEGWKIGKQDCCHDVHCFATPVVQHPDGTWWARDRDGVSWLPVDPAAVDFTTKYVGSHACVVVDPDDGEHRVICAAVGGNV